MLKHLAFLLCFPFFGFAYGSHKTLTIRGQAVAISVGPASSINGNVYRGILVKRSQNQYQSTFIIIKLSVPSETYDTFFTKLPSIHQFKVKSGTKVYSVLREFTPVISEGDERTVPQGQGLPTWVPLPGYVGSQIPFGKPVQVFNSLDWPEAPVL